MSIKLPGRNTLPTVSAKPLPARRDRLLPVAYAGGMLAIGAALLVAKPKFGHVPQPNRMGDGPRLSRWRRAAQRGRDGVQTFAPANVTDSIGRSLMLGGVALLLARALDEIAGRDGQ
ncbi:hypothetical protein CSE45_4085 [Citreicella sp. SE45]|uniref:Uncharacterized protein n=1 Tax=Salipiger thiooxidans TaxID=282683 RepID=A0A1G7EWA0_9RHOB|nr:MULTISPECIES: hypothetical protein [Salipiger]EEX16583.1 hypothetical protein CSE45_4085 [Citreicella sp. SE45]NIY96749.1 hypothetical protein [Salipiger sp. HF18]NVK59349.1 hypothetical protein [Paracoccaceae bacterium]SDE67914.1 hypothetical protein SAMN04488105_106107 [Salipiger thiooxidans]